MHITLIRHLPTEWNMKEKLQGRKDIGIANLTEDYEKKIRENKQQLVKLAPFDLVLASTLNRTHQTAHIYGYKPETEQLLDELDFGPFEGGEKKKLIEVYGDKWIENPKELTLGESLINLEGRITSFIDKYADFFSILAFGHGAWIRAIVSYFHYGDINMMNKIIVENNQCITLHF